MSNDPLAHLTPEQKAMFVGAQTELEKLLAPWFLRYGSQFDHQAIVFSLMVSVARAAHEITPPINEEGWHHASATCWHLAERINAEKAKAEAARSAILAQP